MNDGITVAQRKNGDRAVLWAGNTLEWYSAEEYLWLTAESGLIVIKIEAVL